MSANPLAQNLQSTVDAMGAARYWLKKRCRHVEGAAVILAVLDLQTEKSEAALANDEAEM